MRKNRENPNLTFSLSYGIAAHKNEPVNFNPTQATSWQSFDCRIFKQQSELEFNFLGEALDHMNLQTAHANSGSDSTQDLSHDLNAIFYRSK